LLKPITGYALRVPLTILSEFIQRGAWRGCSQMRLFVGVQGTGLLETVSLHLTTLVIVHLSNES